MLGLQVTVRAIPDLSAAFTEAFLIDRARGLGVQGRGAVQVSAGTEAVREHAAGELAAGMFRPFLKEAAFFSAFAVRIAAFLLCRGADDPAYSLISLSRYCPYSVLSMSLTLSRMSSFVIQPFS